MHILEHTATRLVLQKRRSMMAIIMALFTLLSTLTLASLVLQGISRLDTLDLLDWVSWIVWITLAACLVIFGSLALNASLRGTRCIFDRVTETITLQQPRGWGIQTVELSLYSVTHLVVEKNEEVRAFGLFLALRDGRQLPLATISIHDEDQVIELRRIVRQFLQGTYRP
ncbi:MAG: hypothetical protein H6670_01265 [Anaerolineaceae bacterium]|nr:hypothetical protein [Anaerolineaceae bacterium]